MSKRHLVLALCAKGFGETLLGIGLAQKLGDAGDDVVFLTRESAGMAMGAAPFPRQVISDAALPLLRLYLDSMVSEHRPSTIILADYFTTVFGLEAAGLDFHHLLSYKRPIVAIDTWAMRESGFTIDLFQRSNRVVPDWSHDLDLTVTPVPIAMPRRGGTYYSALPEQHKIAPKVRRHIRRDLGLVDKDRAILFCTSQWQHARFRSRHANRLARQLPLLISHYVAQLGPHAHFIHVGPQRYSLDLHGRYHWLPPLVPQEFDTLLGSVDLLLTANISATTLAKAVAIGTPAVALVNSESLSGVRDLNGHAATLSSGARSWLEEALPIYPFYLWPLGYFKFLKPVLADNDYSQTFSIVEALREREVMAVLSRALFDEDAREATTRAQHEYSEMVRSLPPVARDIHRLAS
jgi:hypothetical protein